MARRKKLPVDVRQLVLHEGGYLCGNPACRFPLTLDVHHLDPIGEGGPDDPHNLLALCPNGHRLHHEGNIPLSSLRAWKLTLLALSEAYDRRGIDALLALDRIGELLISADAVLGIAGLLASDLVRLQTTYGESMTGPVPVRVYRTTFSSRSVKKANCLLKAGSEGNSPEIRHDRLDQCERPGRGPGGLCLYGRRLSAVWVSGPWPPGLFLTRLWGIPLRSLSPSPDSTPPVRQLAFPVANYGNAHEPSAA
jgi:HNH endonuclease